MRESLWNERVEFVKKVTPVTLEFSHKFVTLEAAKSSLFAVLLRKMSFQMQNFAR